MIEENYNTPSIEEEEAQVLIDELEDEEEQGEKNKKRLRKKIIKRNIIILILLIIIILLLLKGCGSDIMMAIYTKPEISNPEYVEQDKGKVRKDYIDVYTLMNGRVSENNQYIAIRVPSSNAKKFYLKYEIYIDNNDVLSYATELIDVKEDEDFMFTVNMYDLLDGEKGNHSVVVKTRAFDYITLKEASSSSQRITITVN